MSLPVTLSIFSVLFFVPLLTEFHFTGIITSRAVLSSAVLIVAFTVLHCRRTRRSAAERKRGARLGQRGEVEGALTKWILVAVVVLFFMITGRCVAAEGADLDAALMELTAKYQPDVVLTAEEFAGVRDLTIRTAILLRVLQTTPAGMPAAMQNKRSRVRVQLEKIIDELLQVSVDHAATVLRRMPAQEVPR